MLMLSLGSGLQVAFKCLNQCHCTVILRYHYVTNRHTDTTF